MKHRIAIIARALRTLIAPIALIAVATTTSACGDIIVPEPTGPSFSLIQSPQFGQFVGDADGMALYVFANDRPGTATAAPVSACTGGCLDTWPPYLAFSTNVATGLDPARFGVYTRADGTEQSTYNGWPLYSYAADVNSGDVRGHGSGGIWFLAGTN